MGVSGNTRWAVVLCSFQDVIAKFDHDPAYLKTFFNETGAGKGGLFDYWHDMSYGRIDLTNSDVFGPYRMQYSFGKDYGLPREAYVTEAIRILSCAGMGSGQCRSGAKPPPGETSFAGTWMFSPAPTSLRSRC
jgi:hypothetical protein